MLTLQESSRHLFREPFGELFSTISEAIPYLTGRTFYAVGDIVTYNLRKQGLAPSVAIIDGHTMRSPCRKILPVTGRHIRVKNPAGTLTDELVAGIRDAIHDPPATVDVTGEEDLAVIPLVIEAPFGSAVLYGQPSRGVVCCIVDPRAKEKAVELLSHFIRS